MIANKKLNNKLREDELISTDNVTKIGERIALRALKTVLSHSYNNRLSKLYMSLMTDISKSNNPDHTLSDGYDLAQSATCFLCQHIGKRLNDVYGKNKHGKTITICNACFNEINRILMNERKESYLIVSNDRPEVINLSIPFQETLEEDYTKVDDIISKMHLTDLQLQTINCYLAGMHFEEIVRYFGIAECSLWFRRQAIKKKYYKYIGTN